MSQDTFTTVTKTGYGSRIMNSIKGILFGILLFFGSFVLLYINEGRVDLSEVARQSVQVASSPIDSANEGKFISTSGKMTSQETVGDNMFFQPGNYVALERVVEMYAWTESKKTKKKENLGGSETTTTTYTYDKKWTSNPVDSSNFAQPEGHSNPLLDVEGGVYKVNSAQVGDYGFDVAGVDLPAFEVLPLNDNMFNTELKASNFERQGPNYLYRVQESTTSPKVGDVRISYKVIHNDKDVTLFGKTQGESVVAYVDSKEGSMLFRVFYGGREQAIQTLGDEYLLMLWMLRGIGFVLMWVGLSMLLGPINIILSFIPAFSMVSRFLLGIITFLIALVLSIVTILVSMIFHNIIALTIAVVIAFAACVYVIRKKMNKKAPVPQAAAE